MRPGIIHATVSADGRTGPWSQRPGFDVDDNMTAWLLAVGITAALDGLAELPLPEPCNS